ncbi:MAG: glutamate--tRNA ligase [Candidatus Peribacteraceae bacterium]|nr:glutamate--tRNA ligase [Candidatus Peribacteraceae bacterium]
MRTRLPPSPTGFLHIGNLRTALFDFLLAKQTKGIFYVRVEDTDRERFVPGAIESMLRSLQWAGISPDEGVMFDANGEVIQKGPHAPYFQSERLDLYKKYAEELVEKGHAYHCFCTPERLTEMRKQQEALKKAPMYDRHCVHLSKEDVAAKITAGERHVVRMKVPHERTVTFNDDIRGEVRFQGHTIDDQVLLKGDGFPTYHLAHVVDDHLMETDLVIRGEEWLSSLPKHILLFEWLGWAPPKYAHVPLLLSKDRKKLSKRDGDVAVEEYIQKGYLPEVMVNFLALLGWNPGTTQEIFTMDELIEQFSLDRVQKAGAIFDLEKLNWLQGQWMRKISPTEFAARILPLVAEKFSAAATDKDFVRKAALIQERITFFNEAPEMLTWFYKEPHASVELLASEKQKITKEQLPEIFQALENILSDVPEKNWTVEGLKTAVQSNLGNFKQGQLLWPLRAALTGLPYSPGAFEVAEVLGKEKTLERLKKAESITQ